VDTIIVAAIQADGTRIWKTAPDLDAAGVIATYWKAGQCKSVTFGTIMPYTSAVLIQFADRTLTLPVPDPPDGDLITVGSTTTPPPAG
jgi:hypothetical protein